MRTIHENYPAAQLAQYDNEVSMRVRPYCLSIVKPSYDIIWQNATDEIDSGVPAEGFDYLDGWFKFGELDAKTGDQAPNDILWFNHCFAESGNEFLLGTYGGRLCKLDSDGKFEIVADGLKNFRLREMKNVNKAKN